jgi:uncharacterized cupin superfamily protein
MSSRTDDGAPLECVVTNAADASQEQCRILRTGEPLGIVSQLAGVEGLRRLRVQHERLPPGRRSSSPHAHTTREEVIYVLSGTPDLWLDGRLRPLRPGDCVVFPSGTGLSHTVINNAAGEAELLTIATQVDDDRCYYPLNPTRGDVDAATLEAWAARPLGPHDGRADVEGVGDSAEFQETTSDAPASV